MRPRYLLLLALPLVLAVGLPLFMAALEMPPYGEVNPTFNQMVTHYHTATGTETGAANIVTGIVLDYRAYDTLIETTVLFAATMGVLLTLAAYRSGEGGPGNGRRRHP